MKSQLEISLIVKSFHEQGETIACANFLIDEYEIRHPNFNNFELREIAKPEYILLTTEGVMGEPQIIRLPENAFEFPLELMLSLIAHEMVHVRQRAPGFEVDNKNEREFQAYYEMVFQKIYPQIPEIPNFQKVFFSKKAIEYYSRMGEASDLQLKYADQKAEIDYMLVLLK